jgi:hypothetical protein
MSHRYERLPRYSEYKRGKPSSYEEYGEEYGEESLEGMGPKQVLVVKEAESDSGVNWSSVCLCVLVCLIILGAIGGVAYYYLKDSESEKDDDDKDDDALIRLVEEVNISKGDKKDINVDNTVDSTEDSTIDTQNNQTSQNVVTSSESIPQQLTLTTLDCNDPSVQHAAVSYLKQVHNDYTITPVVFNKAGDTECDLKYKFVPGPDSTETKGGTDNRRFVFNLNPLSVSEMKGALSGQTTMNMGDSIYDCNSDTILKAAKSYYEAKIKKSIGIPTYTAILISGTPVKIDQNLQCDIKLQNSVDGSQSQPVHGGTTETHRFTFARNVDNEWEVVGSTPGDITF